MILSSIYGSYLNEKRKGRNVKLSMGVHRNVYASNSLIDVLFIAYEGTWGLIDHCKRVPHLKRMVCNSHAT